jgi:ABC-type lipoprotein export system ATPase subunit
MILAADDLKVAFTGRVVLDGYTVTIAQGDQCALTGRSGAGKTTLLLVLAGLLRPTAGTVDLRVPRAQVVYVPQAPSLVPELTALQNASIGLRVRGVPPSEATERAREQLTILGLYDAVDALPSELSGGMQQRVALARALVIEPKLLLADEPTGALDRAMGAHVLDVITQHAARTAATVIVATHDPEVVSRFPRRIDLDEEQRR